MNCFACSSDNSSLSESNSQQSVMNKFGAQREISTSNSNTNPPEIPACCCMSGCANCVYIQYAAEVADYFKQNSTAALKFVDSIEDETLKTFLRMEIEHILLKQK